MSVSTAPHRSSAVSEPCLIPIGSLAGKPPVSITHPVSLIGSRRSAHVRIQSRSISRSHALLICANGEALISDLGSRAKVIVNGRPRQEAELEDGDIIKLGRFSFKFAAASEEPPRRFRPLPPAKLQLEDGSFTRLSRRVMLIGRRSGADLVIDSNAASSSHAVVFEMNGRRYVRDLGSRTGTYINDEAFRQIEIKPGDVIRIGDAKIQYLLADEDPSQSQGDQDSPATAILPQPGESEELWDAEKAPALPNEEADLNEEADDEEDAAGEEPTDDHDTHAQAPPGLPVMKTLIAPTVMSQSTSDELDDLLDLVEEELHTTALEKAEPQVVEQAPPSPQQNIEEPASEETPPQDSSPTIRSEQPATDVASTSDDVDVTASPIEPVADDHLATVQHASAPSEIAPIIEPPIEYIETGPAFGFLEESRIEAFSSIDVRLGDLHPADMDLAVTFAAFVGPSIGQLEESRANAFVGIDQRLGDAEIYFEPTAPFGTVLEFPLVGQLEETRSAAFDLIDARLSEPEIRHEQSVDVESPHLDAPPGQLEEPRLEAFDHIALRLHETEAIETAAPIESGVEPSIGHLEECHEISLDHIEGRLLEPEIIDIPAIDETPTEPSLGVLEESRSQCFDAIHIRLDEPVITSVPESPAASDIRPELGGLDEVRDGAFAAADLRLEDPVTLESETPSSAITQESSGAATKGLLEDPRTEAFVAIDTRLCEAGVPYAVVPWDGSATGTSSVADFLLSLAYAQPQALPQESPVPQLEYTPPSVPSGRGRLAAIVLVMLFCMAGSAAAIWKLLPPNVTVEGAIRFENLATLSANDRAAFQQRQQKLLADPEIHRAAAKLYHTVPSADVSDAPEATAFSVHWSPDSAGRAMLLSVAAEGHDGDADGRRLSALLQALYETDLRQSGGADAAVETLRRLAANARGELAELLARKERLAATEAARPTSAELAETTSAVDKLDVAWASAMGARRALHTDLDRMRKGSDVVIDASTEGADGTLRDLLEQLARSEEELTKAKSAAAAMASSARKNLDQSIDAFEKSLAAAQAEMKDASPLAAYVAAAKSLSDAARKFQADLIARQERQQSSLLDFQKQMVARLEKRRRELLDSDSDLKDLTHLLDLKTRERSAAEGSGLKRDAARIADEIKYINDRIDARRKVLLDDPFYADVITGLQSILNTLRGQLDTDRTQSEKTLARIEEAFATASPPIEKLPESHRRLANQIADDAQMMAKARKDFAAASAAADPQSGDALKTATAATEGLRAAVAARRVDLNSEAQKRAAARQAQSINAKEAELTEAVRTESAARDAFQAKRQELDRLASRERSYQDAKEELERIARLDEPGKRQQVSKLASELANAERLAEAAVKPAPPAPAAVTHLDDPRGLYSASALGFLAILFGLVLVFNGVSRASL